MLAVCAADACGSWWDVEADMTNGTYYAILGAIIMIIMILGVFISNKL